MTVVANTQEERRWPTRRLRAGVAILALIGARALVASAQEAAVERSTAAGVYTTDQADRGRTVFDAKCESCHGADLEGGTLAPALKGGEFLSSFEGKPLRRIYSRIISTMPPEEPGSLTESETLALVAVVLRSNGYPAGAEALARADDLNSIVVAPPEKQDELMWNRAAAENDDPSNPLRSLRAPRSRSVR